MEFRKLRPDEIEVRIGQKIGKKKDGISLLLYKDARCDMIILDETVGAENWQRHHEVVNGNLFCNVGIYVDRKGDGYGDWVWKQDVGTESNTEREKGQASDAFKRACTNWGIGRELYTGPRMQLWAGQFNAGFDSFSCSNIEYDGRRIKSVTIKVKSTGKEHTFSHDTSAIEATEIEEPVSEKDVQRMEATLSENQVAWVYKHYGVSELSQLNVAQYAEIFQSLAEKQAKQGGENG